MSNYDIYGIGAALVDTEIEVTDTDLNQLDIPKGVMTLVDEARQAELVEALEGHLIASKRASGGSAANSIIAAQYLGAKTFYSCKVADDENGHFYLKDMSDAGVTTKNIEQHPEGITGKCLVMITPDAERTMNTFLGISETVDTNVIDEEALKVSRYAYIEGYLVTSETGLPAAIRLRELAEEHGVKTALSLSDPAIVEYFHDGLSKMIGNGVDLIFCNEAEALQYTKEDTLEGAITALKSVSKAFAITRGANPSILFDGEQTIEVEVKPISPVDTNGAGDMFAGTFLAAITQGKSFKEAGEIANKAAGMVVSQFGPRLRPEQYAELSF